tara:strand:+ start:54 stop:596 length:543 start_codon:yes stop_codon:yes gene_type:complete
MSEDLKKEAKKRVEAAFHPEDCFEASQFAAEKAKDFELAVKCLEKGFDFILEEFDKGYTNHGLRSCPEEQAAMYCDELIWIGPTINPETLEITAWKCIPVPPLNDEEGIALWKQVKPVMRKIYETWEDKFWDNCDGANFNFGVKTGWGEGFYNEYLLRKIEHDFSEEVDWIERIKNKINN